MDIQSLQEYAALLEELKTRKQHQSQVYIPDDNPNRNQKAFHQSDARYRLILGGNRSGKSRCSAQEINWWLTESHPYLKTPKSPRIWVLSAEYRTIFEGIWTHLKAVFPPWEIARIGPQIAGHNMPGFVEFKKGGRVDFISAQGGGDDTRKKLQAAEIDLLCVDEEIPSSLWLELKFRLLTRGGKVVVSATLVESEDWILELEDKAILGQPNYFLVRLDTRFNKYNDSELLNEMLLSLSDEEKEVRIHGKRKRISGLIYTNWRDTPGEEIDSNLVDPFVIPPDWTRVMCLDPGYRTFAGLWVAFSPLNLAVAYREMYLQFTELSHVANFIKTSEEGEDIFERLIDPSAFRHYEDGSVGVGFSLAEDYNLYFNPAMNDKMKNIEDVRRWLLPTNATNKNGLKIPGFRIFRTLENFQSERRKYKIKPDRSRGDRDESPDRPLAKYDHLMNCWEYLASQRYSYLKTESLEEYLNRAVHLPDSEIILPSDNRMLKVQLWKKRKKKDELRERGRLS